MAPTKSSKFYKRLKHILNVVDARIPDKKRDQRAVVEQAGKHRNERPRILPHEFEDYRRKTNMIEYEEDGYMYRKG